MASTDTDARAEIAARPNNDKESEEEPLSESEPVEMVEGNKVNTETSSTPTPSNGTTAEEKEVLVDDEIASLLDEDDGDNQCYELAEIVEKELKNNKARPKEVKAVESDSTTSTDRHESLRFSLAGQTAKIATNDKNARFQQTLRRQSHSAEKAAVRNSASSMGGFSLDEDVATVDKFLFNMCYCTLGLWLSLICFSYWVAPRDSIQWLVGTERNAALVELSILSTAVIMKHGPLLWEINFMEITPPNWGERSSTMFGVPRISGILAGGLTVQFVAVSTMVIMVCFPVPVMLDPVLGSRVHLLRWCEWTPLAGFMTLMTECIDAPILKGEKLTHPWNKKFFVAAMESLSTLCGLAFPFCTPFGWYICMTVSFITFFAIFWRYFERRAAFGTMTMGGSVDETELYDRARMSLALHGMCCVVWSMITVMYFVSSAGHMVTSTRWAILHDPAATMIEECLMDLIAKILYMALIIEAHNAAFDEAKRANRRLAELKSTMSVVWENSSDTISISVRKMSGSVTSMVSPSFFRPVLANQHQDRIDDISAIVLELDGKSMEKRRDSYSGIEQATAEVHSPQVGMRIIRKADFAGIDLHSPMANTAFQGFESGKADPMSLRVFTFADMMARAWQSKLDETVFEHDATLSAGGSRTKFEVKVTRLEENAIVVVIRDVSERYRRFEAEKRFVFETTARQKDAEANRFTRHEVKNGLLGAIEICGNIREQISDDFNLLQKEIASSASEAIFSEQSLAGRVESISELDRTLHEVLDIVLAETVRLSSPLLRLHVGIGLLNPLVSPIINRWQGM